jgi:pilus assembly protein CpaE
MQKMGTPRLLLIDVSSAEEPLRALAELSNVVEPDVRVLVIGERDSLEFYREITRGLGATEYLPKPLPRERLWRTARFPPPRRSAAMARFCALGRHMRWPRSAR